MKKKPRRMALNRETLRSLEDLRSVPGGATYGCDLTVSRCGGCTNENSYGCGGNTLENCSNLCETGGACTTSC
jgi:hypothetical protein